VPIYVPLDSVDVWSAPTLFRLDGNGRPTAVAGCPPDSFSADGQLWGNPLYDWDKMKETGYAWWVRRLSAAAKMYDVVRLDHFRGFESYWAVPAGDQTAAGGSWQQGPGNAFIRAIRAALPELEFIAEDLGYVTPEVRQLQEESGYPGMKVLQFAFDSRETSDYLPHTYPVNSVCYTGTHDNLTLVQWFQTAAPEDVALAKAYLGLNDEEGPVWGMIRGGMSSVSRLCVIQMQDYLELGAWARMNFPGTLSSDNWSWRAKKGFITEALTKKIYETTRRYGRL
jgi:4-alpha-glucanotransferase